MLLALLAILCGLTLFPAAAAPPAGYYLVWGDEFNGTSLDTTKWGYWCDNRNWGKAFNRGATQVSVTNGYLVITTQTSGTTTYTAMLASQNHFHPRYGYYEASIQWGDYSGMWSAFWLRSPILGTYSYDPLDDGGELDVCEHRQMGIYGTNIADIVSDNIHWNGYGSAEQSTGSPNIGSGLGTGFHTYSLLWTSNTYDFGIDGSTLWHTGWNGSPPTPTFGSGVYIILSSQVDDNGSPPWAGYIPSGGYPTGTNQLVVDYFRYYAPTNVLFWTGGASAYWTNSANWVSNLPPLASSDLTFSYLSGNLSTTLGRDYTVDGLIFLYTANGVSINGTNTLTLGAGGIDTVAANHNVTLNAPLRLAANQQWTIGRNSPGRLLTVNSSLAGAATLTKAGYGTLILKGTNAFSGTLNVDSANATINDGVLLIACGAAITNAASPIYIRNTGNCASILQFSNSFTIPQIISLAGRATNVAAVEVLSGTNTLAAGLTLAGGGSFYALQCDTGKLVLAGTTAAGSTATGPRSLLLQGNGDFVLSGLVQNGSASPLSLVKSNNGTLTLCGTNTFTGTTTNATGSLYLSNSLAGPLVLTGGTLYGLGTVAGDSSILGGTLSPGAGPSNAIGTLSFGGKLTLSTGVTTLMELSPASQTNDQLKVAGMLTCAGTLSVVNLGGTLAPGRNFQLFNAASYSGYFSTVTLPTLDNGLAWDTTRLYTSGLISVAALPSVMVSPAQTNVECGGTLTLTATASGTPPLTYQWLDNQPNAIAGATNATLTRAGLAGAQAGLYTVQVTNNVGSASATAAVTVSDTTPPRITLNGSNPLTIECHSAFTDPGATALDACAGPVAVATAGHVDPNTLGTYVLVYTANDPSGNAATNTRVVYVVVPPAETLAVTNLGGGRLQLNWDLGTLQSATNAAGPYRDIPDATAPYTIQATNAQQFYRVRE